MVTYVSPLNFASFSIASILICFTCLVCMALRRRFDKLQSKLFMLIIVDVAITAVASAVTELANPLVGVDGFATLCVKTSNHIYFPAHMVLAPLFCLYVLVVCGGSLRWRKDKVRLCAIPFLLIELICLVNPFTHWVFYYDAGDVYTRNWALYILYVVSVLYMLLGLITLLRHWTAVTKRTRLALGYFFLMASLGVVVQLVLPTVRVELFAESLAVIGVMLFVEDEADLMDHEMGVYNRHALSLDLRRFSTLSRSYHVVAVRIASADALSLLDRADLTERFDQQAAGFLKTLTPWYTVYRAAPMRYLLVDPGWDGERARRVAQHAAQRFGDLWRVGDIEFSPRATVAVACVPDDLSTPEEVLYLLDTPVPMSSAGGILTGDDLGYLVRRASVERAVRRGLEKGSYEVHYQPVYSADGTVHAAEALMRLHDEELGNVPPDEFIEVAERIGAIEDIGRIALEEACSFLASGIPQQRGISSINVNLSVVQCMQADFVDRVEEVIERYGVDPGQIAFEITESVAASNDATLREVMSELRGKGHRFSMDDYGTGYSNMHAILAFDFDVVKIDKSVLWDAEQSETGMAILQSSVRMLHSVGCAVLVEGVETARHVELLRKLGVDYFQGYYFARPMPVRDLLAFLG